MRIERDPIIKFQLYCLLMRIQSLFKYIYIYIYWQLTSYHKVSPCTLSKKKKRKTSVLVTCYNLQPGTKHNNCLQPSSFLLKSRIKVRCKASNGILQLHLFLHKFFYIFNFILFKIFFYIIITIKSYFL